MTRFVVQLGSAAVVVLTAIVALNFYGTQPGVGGPATPAPTASPSSAPITGTLPAEQTAVIARHAEAVNSRDAEAFVDVFAVDGAFNPRGTFAASSSPFSNTLPIADRSLLEPFMAINDAWDSRAEVVSCDQLTRAEYARRYTVHSDNVEVFAHCAVTSRWPRLSLEIGEWWNYELRGSDILWWSQAVRDATPGDRSPPLGLDGLLDWESWLEATDADAAARLLNPRVYPVNANCGSGGPEPRCEWSSDDVDVERIASDGSGRGEHDWAIGGQRFWPGALIPYDPADAAEIQASIDEFLSQRGDE
ncbi:MAG: hypothetical protein H0V12_01020 [Chloroflexi bacterium]|nr:hypothetical protein [Chloroflexota bacterium]